MRRTHNLSLICIVLLAAGPLQAQLLFSEVMAVNSTGAFNPVIEEPGDWIEIYNGTPYTLDLSDYYLSDDVDDPLKWRFPDKTYIIPGTYHLVWADGTNDTIDGSHTNFKLAVTGESLFIHKSTGELYDSLSFPRMYENISFGSSQDGSGVYFGVPTPGERNDSGSGFLVAGGVTFDPPSALYSSPIQVSLIPEHAGTIRYSLDGSPPDLSDPIYSSPFTVTENTVVRARLWMDGFAPGDIATSSYIIGNGFTLPVVSLVTDPTHLWDDMNGIYVEGTNGIPGYCSEDPKNWNQDWERPLSLEYFNLQGTRQLQQDGGTKIHGGCSRQNPMKSLAFFARSRYGNNNINYPFFSKKEADNFKGLILRNSGNDFQYSFFRDAMIQAVASPGMDVDGQAYEPVQVLLNGEYWGIHNLREKVNEHWVTSNYGIPVENLDFIKNRNEVFAGSYDGYDSLQNYLMNNSLTSNENFQVVADWIDIGSYTNYLCMHLFFANRDWPGNNQKYWRDRLNGTKWRWILFDLDFTMGIYDFDPSIDMFTFSTASDSDEWPNPAWSTLLIRRLLENNGFRDRFIQQYLMHLNTTLSGERVNHVIDSFYYRLADIFPAHIERWNRPPSMDEWDFWVDQLRQFATQRPDLVRQNMRNFFSLENDIHLEIEPQDSSGHIMANGVSIPPDGMRGVYSAGVELNLEFHTTPGYRFKQWEVIKVNSGDTALYEGSSLSFHPTEGIIVRTSTEVSNEGLDVDLYINEFMASNQGAFLDEFGEDADWIEIYNAGEMDVDLGGFYMTDELEEPTKWMIPFGYQEATTIKTHDFLVLFADGNVLQGPLHLDFKLNSGGESIGLTAMSGSNIIWIDSIRFGPQVTDISLGRFPDGGSEWMAMQSYTPKNSNLVTLIPDKPVWETELNVFPNPATVRLNIKLQYHRDGTAGQANVVLHDLTGRRAWQGIIEGWNNIYTGSIDISGLPAGVYILSVDVGTDRISKKIIKTQKNGR